MSRAPIILFLAIALPMLSACGLKQAEVVNHSAIEVPDGKETKPIALRKIVAKVPRGTEIGVLKGGLACVTYGTISWRSGKVNIGDEEFTSIFYEELKRLNYNVVGDPTSLFEDNRGNAEIAVGGLITSINAEVCYPLGGWGDFSNGSASASISVEWQVYNTLDKKVILRTTANGGGNTKFTNGMANEAYYLAFSNAVQGLLADPKFIELVRESESGPMGDLTDAKPQVEPAKLPAGKRSSDVKSLADAQHRVVVLQMGGGHGSGFFVGDAGYILTNHHVVTNKKRIRVVMDDGTILEGQVIKSDPRQDVGLVKVDLPAFKGLTVRSEELPVGTDVYAIGAPFKESLQGSVSKGVVSSYRTDSRGRWLQSDTTINGGNSGGPLVDAQGRVVGISTSKIVGENIQGLNFFVPIAEAVRLMGL